jgi:hypothetical protein
MIEIYSLVDITNTKILRSAMSHNADITSKQWEHKRNQQRNFETIIQLLGLRFKPMDIQSPIILKNQNLKDYTFGDCYKDDTATIWKCTCRYDFPPSVESLKEDFNNIPIITGLTESIILPYTCFITMGEYCNLLII